MRHSALQKPSQQKTSQLVKEDIQKQWKKASDQIAGKRVAVLTNHTGLINEKSLVDILHEEKNVELAAILAPEHGFRGQSENGKPVSNSVDPKTGVPIFSLYGNTKKPTPSMLHNIDLIIFDIQDIGTRFYTYISTMGLAMQAAAEAQIPFIVFDRPNPLGGDYVSGFVPDPTQKSFLTPYPIPIIHGLTVGELAQMIKGEKYIKNLDNLDLRVIEMRNWDRSHRWSKTGRKWVSTSPNIPTFNSALIYPGTSMIGEIDLVNEGRGTPTPFTVFGAPWLDAKPLAAQLNALKLPGVVFEPTRYTPRPIPHVATNPNYVGRQIEGIRINVTNAEKVQPLELGMHILALLTQKARSKRLSELFYNRSMLHHLSGTKQLHRMVSQGFPGAAIINSWRSDIDKFKQCRQPYLLY